MVSLVDHSDSIRLSPVKSPGPDKDFPQRYSPYTPSSDLPSGRKVYVKKQMHKLLRKMERKVKKRRRELVLARLVLVAAGFFLVTWLPYIVSR